MKILAIGYGNRLRGDDGVGPLVAEPIAYRLLIPAIRFDYCQTFSAIAFSGVKWVTREIAGSVEGGAYCHIWSRSILQGKELELASLGVS